MARPIMAQSNFSASKSVDVIVNSTIEAVAWVGHNVVYLKDITVGYAIKAWQLAEAFFKDIVGFITKRSRAFTVVGLETGPVAVSYALSRSLGRPSSLSPPPFSL